MGDNTNPILVAEGGFNVPFLVRFKYLIEDRRPDLSEEQAEHLARKVLQTRFCVDNSYQ